MPSPVQADYIQSALQQLQAKNAPATVLRSFFEEQLRRGEGSADFAATLALYKAWNGALPDDKIPKERMLPLLADGKRYDAAIAFNQPHFDAPDERFSGRLKMAMDLYFSGRDDEVWARAEKIIVDTRKEHAARYSDSKGASGWSPFRASSAALGLAGALELQARVLLRRGQTKEALVLIEEGSDAIWQSLDIAKVMPPNEVAAAAVFQSKETQAGLLLQKIRAQMASGSHWAAGRTLEVYLPLSREVEAHPRYFWNIAVSRYNQRSFVQSEAYFRRADAAAQLQGYPNLSFFRADCAQGIVGAIEGQRKWREAALELERLDALAGDDETLQYRIRYRFERGYAYVRAGIRLGEALELLQELTQRGGDGLFAAHAMGLHGVVLWRLHKDPAQALVLLKDAVEVYMTPVYFDDQSLGLNGDVRDLVVETYLEAIFQTVGEDPMKALGPAEWVRNSTVQSALADAAIRTAAKDPVLAELVRKDQDLRNEIRNLKTKAAVELDSSVSTRLNDLNILRAQIHAQIKLKFPEYDQLTAPAPPNLEVAGKALAADEVLLLLLPTDHSVFVWALEAGGKSDAARVEWPKAELAKLVKDLRNSLDFGVMDGNAGAFNTRAAFEIYKRLLAPVQKSLEGKTHMIVAAGGALGQIPFGVLLRGPAKSTGSDAPYLIKQLAISHVPSLSAWLAANQFSGTPRAPEALIAWGDPSFAAVGQVPPAAHANARRISFTRSTGQQEPDALTEKSGLRYSDIPYLPETREELLAIASALRANPETDLHLGLQATKASVLQSSASGELVKKKVVVFATHGLMAGDLPHLTQPALALANTGDDVQDPLAALLTLEEVLGLKLNADWVVLSACNTAAADGKVEEAMSGLARGFFYAGSRSLLVTHWAVETESAKLLTTYTFRNYGANPTERKAESLRQAMLTVMAIPGYAHPAYWGPYALVGDGGR